MSLGFSNNKGTDQPAHLRRLNSAFVIRFLVSIISKLAPSKMSIFQLVSVTEQACLRLDKSETPKTVFSRRCPIIGNVNGKRSVDLYR